MLAIQSKKSKGPRTTRIDSSIRKRTGKNGKFKYIPSQSKDSNLELESYLLNFLKQALK